MCRRYGLGPNRPSDTIARFGGEEFVVVLPNCTTTAAIHAIDRLRAAVPGGQTCSAGIATRLAGEPADELPKRADAAMYAAKRDGRDRTVAARAKAGRRSTVGGGGTPARPTVIHPA